MIAAIASSEATSAASSAMQHHKLVDAAQHFEAIFLQEMMKPFAPDKDDDSADGEQESLAGGGTYQSMGVESMASAISRAGGLGIARSVVASVERQQHGRLEQQKSSTHD